MNAAVPDAAAPEPPDAVQDSSEPLIEVDAGRDARLWVKTLADFLAQHVPTLAQHHDDGCQADDNGLIPYCIQSARNQAVAAAFERIERICRSDIDGRGRTPSTSEE